MNTIVHFYHGLHGSGVVVSVTYDHSRVIFDFGAPFEPLAQICDGVIQKRDKHRVTDALLLHQVPYVPGVFARQDLFDTPLIAYEESSLTTAILISHLHLDHMSEIDKVHPLIPVYMHQSAYALKKTLEEIGEDEAIRDYQPFAYEEEILVGDIRVIPYFSDHPCYGSSGFLIQTPDATLFYSGDIRFHGLQAERAYAELDKIAGYPLDLLIIDGTTYSNKEFARDPSLEKQYRIPSKEYLPSSVTEQEIYDGIIQELTSYYGIAVFNIYHRDMQLIESLLMIGDKTHREVVFEPATAYIVYRLLGIVPNVYWPEAASNERWMDLLKEHSRTVQKEAILKNPQQYFIQNSYRYITELIDFDGIAGKYVHLFGEPLVKGSKQYAIMENIVAKLHWQFLAYTNLFSFNHAYPNQLAYMIEKLHAKTVVAVHSKTPELLNPVHSKQVLPEEGKDYILINGELVLAE